MIEEPWYPSDRCSHPLSEVNRKIVFGGGLRVEKQVRCLVCHEEGGYPVTWLNLGKRGGEKVA